MFFNNNNNFTGVNFDHSVLENDDFGLTGYGFEETNSEPSTRVPQVNGFDSDPTLAGLSTSEIVEWWLGPKLDDGVNQYTGSTLLDPSHSEFAGLYGSQIGDVPGTNGFLATTALDNFYGLNAPEQRYVDVPECAGPSMAGPSTMSYPTLSSQQLPPPPANFVGPITTPSPVPTLSWGYSPPPTTSYVAAENDRPHTYNRPLIEPTMGGQWPNPTSVGKGKARAMDHLPQVHPSTAGDTMWQYQQPYMPQDYEAGSNPQMDAGVLNNDFPTQVAPTTGPQRSVRRAKGKRKEADKAEGKQKRIPKKDLAPGINWPNTYERFCGEMAEIYYSQPTGGVPNPEMAYASITKFIKEDLYLSPLVVKPLGERASRDLERYLTGILNELRPRSAGQKRGVQYLLEWVAQELEDGLVVVNVEFALQDGPPTEIDPNELDASPEAVRRRIVEKGRRGAIRNTLERMTLLFKVSEPEYLWTRPQVLFFAITYLMFGAGVFGNGGELFTPKPQL